ncbi:MAG: polyprenyl synthetase family protein [Bacillota bacterium]|jgi:heptaprenyl diphosphate synthase
MKQILKNKYIRDMQSDLDFFETYLQQSVSSDEPLVASSVLHLVKAGGKRMRPKFAILAAQANEYDLDKMLPLLAGLELLHTGSLIHDDVIDGASKRRGNPTVNAIHGNKTAVFIGDFLVGRAFELVAQYNDDRIISAIETTVTEMTKGELRQVADFYRVEQTIEDYFYRIERKTALLFSTSCETGACVSGASDKEIEALRQYGYYLGMAFQIMDDILDMTADEKVLGKPVGSDLRQGNISLPVIYCLKNSDDKEKLRQMILDSRENTALIKPIIDLVKFGGGMEYAKKIADDFIKKALAEVDKLKPGKHCAAMKEIADMVVKRNY